MKHDVERVIKEVNDRAVWAETYAKLDGGMYMTKDILTGIAREADEAVAIMKTMLPKAPVFKTGETPVFCEYADGTGGVEINKWADWTCPSCGWFVGEQYIPRRHNQRKCNFCSKCGQKIDWESVKQEKKVKPDVVD